MITLEFIKHSSTQQVYPNEPTNLLIRLNGSVQLTYNKLRVTGSELAELKEGDIIARYKDDEFAGDRWDLFIDAEGYWETQSDTTHWSDIIFSVE